MLVKKTICMLAAGAMLAGAAPVFADHARFRGHGDRERVMTQGIPVPAQYQRHAYRGHRGHPAYHGQPVYAAPAYAAPVYVERDNTAAVLGGAALGAMLGSQFGDHHSRAAATAIGAVFGAILGSELSDR